MNRPRLRIVGCGNADAGDDAAGLIIADQLRACLAPEVDIRTESAPGANLLHWCEHVAVLILIDAALGSDDLPPGRWRRFVFPADRRRLQGAARRGAHGWGIVEALDLADFLNMLPSAVSIFAVAGARFVLGSPLSRSVRASLPEVVRAVEAEVARCLGPTRGRA